MKFLNFNFSHPFKGRARLTRLSKSLSISSNLIIDSKKNNSFEIPIDGCEDGKWKISLDWRHDHKSYFYEKIFSVKDANVLELE